jgi:hypothetical protein
VLALVVATVFVGTHLPGGSVPGSAPTPASSATSVPTSAAPSGSGASSSGTASAAPAFAYEIDAGSPPEQATDYDDFFPRNVIVAAGSIVTLRISGSHTATLLPAGQSAAADRGSDPNVTAPSGCGTPDDPCPFDGTAAISAGPPPPGSSTVLTIRITAPLGTYVLHSKLQDQMIGSLTVVAPGSSDVSTPDDIALAISDQVASDVPTSVPASQYPGLAGVDISYPDCRRGLPKSSPGSLAIVGVGGGKMFHYNPCLAAQYAWAQQQGTPSLYVNTNAAYGLTGENGTVGPAGTCAPGATSCRGYNYGYNGARDLWQYASRQLGPSNLPGIWWLDVETANSWFTSQPGANQQVIQGALDFLGKPGRFNAPSLGYTVGIYSTTMQWTRIVGPNYRPGVPVWYATVAKTAAAALNWCTTPFDNSWGFTGGRVWLVQYQPGGRDTNVGCP